MEDKEEIKLENLPMHELRSQLKKRNIAFKVTDKKTDLIDMLSDGETKHKPKPKKKAPRLQDQKTEKALPIVPKEIRAELEELAEKGLKWKIDEKSGCINFMRDIPTCANLDQSAKNILRTARSAFGTRRPLEQGNYVGANAIAQSSHSDA